MMPFQAMRLRAAAGPSLTGSFVGANFAVDQSSSTATLNVPAGTATGDRLYAILRCRGDRTFTIPSGWDIHQNGTVIPLGNSGTSSDTRIYIVSKPFAGETSVSFTHSAAAAYGYALASVRGSVISQDINSTPTINKQHAGTLVLVVHYNSSASADNSTLSGYTKHGTTYFNSGGTYFYAASIFTHASMPAGSVFVNATPNGGSAGSWAAEVGQ